MTHSTSDHRQPRGWLRKALLIAVLFGAVLIGVRGLIFAVLAMSLREPHESELRDLMAVLAALLLGSAGALFTAVYWKATVRIRVLLGLLGAVLLGSAMATWSIKAWSLRNSEPIGLRGASDGVDVPPADLPT